MDLALVIRLSSASLNWLGFDLSAEPRFSSTCSKLLMPLKITDTSGWFHTHCRAHSAGVLLTVELEKSAAMSFGVRASLPHRSGSMTMIEMPFDAAYFKPAVPAWLSVSI